MAVRAVPIMHGPNLTVLRDTLFGIVHGHVSPARAVPCHNVLFFSHVKPTIISSSFTTISTTDLGSVKTSIFIKLVSR